MRPFELSSIRASIRTTPRAGTLEPQRVCKTIAARAPRGRSRKVRTPKDTELGNTQAGQPDGTVPQKPNRRWPTGTGKGETVV